MTSTFTHFVFDFKAQRISHGETNEGARDTVMLN
jgi:hypothetical protein